MAEQRPPRIGSKPKPKDPQTEQVRNTLTNPFSKKYGPRKGS